jgi:hypothetical protein
LNPVSTALARISRAARTYRVGDVVFALLALACSAPMWLVSYPPIQDLPQHLATIRVIHDYGNPALHFSSYFTLALSKTQYLTYYLAVHLLAYPLGVFVANKVVVTASLVALPYAARALARRLGADPWNALLVLPLVWNSQLILGFVNFVAAIPLALWGIALAIDLRASWSRRRAFGLLVLALVCFYTHVVPFGVLAAGTLLVALGRDWRRALECTAPLAPAAVAAAVWLARTPAGAAARTAAVGSTSGPKPTFERWDEALGNLWTWLTDILRDQVDEQTLVIWAALVVVALAAGGEPSGGSSPARRRLGLLAALVLLGYFIAPTSYSWIWPISGRFPILAAILLVPLLPPMKKGWAVGVQLVAAAAGLVCVWATGSAFRSFEREEVADLPAAIATIPVGQRVAGLVFDATSRYVKFSPFLHSVAWYQAERGGAVMFTFADFAASPVVFRPDNRPPRVGPRWEWMPGAVDPIRDLSWYDWVLVRGGPGRMNQSGSVWERVYQSPRWSVWRRSDAARTSGHD